MQKAITPHAPIPHSTDRIAGLDGLRALAITLVLAFHLFPEVAPYGYLGVDIFFVLSGYFIAQQIGCPDANISRYLLRRILRLYPVLVTVIACTLIAGWFLLLPEDYKALGYHSLTGLGFLTNQIPPNADGYFSPRADQLPLLHLWSIGVEMQVYLTSALLLPLATRLVSLRWVLSAAILFGLHSLYTGLNDPTCNPFYDPAARIWQFALGGMVATLTARPGWARATLPLCLTLLVVILVPTPDIALPQARSIAVTLLTAALIHALTQGGNTALSTGPAPKLGQISYSLYLWHWPVLVLWTVSDLNGTDSTDRLVILTLSVFLSFLTWRALERPAQRRDRTPLPSVILISLVAPIAIVAASISLAGGVAKRLPTEALEIYASVQPAHDLAQTCHSFTTGIVPPKRACRFNADQGQITTAVLGDSHAMVLAGGLARTGLPFVEYSFSGCVPTTRIYPESHGPACSDWVSDAMDLILDDPEIRTVIVAARWAFYTEPRFDNGRGGRDVHPDTVMRDRKTGTAVGRDEVEQAMAATLQRITQSGRNLLLYYPGPTFGWNIRDTHSLALWRDTPLDTGIALSVLLDRQSGMRRMLDTVTGESIARYDPLPRFCQGNLCQPQAADGTLLLDDQDHLSRAGADMMAHDIRDLLKSRGW